MAGHDTTAATVACAGRSWRPTRRRWRRFREVDDARRRSGVDCRAAETARWRLDDAMKEAMRLYPAVLIVVRKADEGVGGTLAGTRAHPGGRGAWMSPTRWGDPGRRGGPLRAKDVAKYRSERFAEARATGASPSDAYMPFGEDRACAWGRGSRCWRGK